jgi:hypothetical protein
LYYRIHSGIDGSGMTAFSNVFKGSENYLWDVINFLQVASYPTMHRGINLELRPIPDAPLPK